MRIPRSIPVAMATLGCCLALSGTAFADSTVSATVGPVAIPSVPLSVCVTAPGLNKCIPTPAVKSVTLKVTATALNPSVGATPPTITKIPCPAGTNGAAAEIATGSSSVSVGGSVSATLSPLPPITVPLVPTVAAPGKTVKLYACTGAS
jgi:hypothetical protein